MTSWSTRRKRHTQFVALCSKNDYFRTILKSGEKKSESKQCQSQFVLDIKIRAFNYKNVNTNI